MIGYIVRLITECIVRLIFWMNYNTSRYWERLDSQHSYLGDMETVTFWRIKATWVFHRGEDVTTYHISLV
jgi:hypothetical protein